MNTNALPSHRHWRLLMCAGVFTSVSLAPLGSLAQTGAATQSAPAGDARNGGRLYAIYSCYACHGTLGHGGSGPALTPTAASFRAFRNYIRKPTGTMPAYTSKVISEAALTDIHAYLRSIPPGPAPQDIPLLNQRD